MPPPLLFIPLYTLGADISRQCVVYAYDRDRSNSSIPMRKIHDGNQAVAWDLPVHHGSAQPVMWSGQGPLQSQNPVVSEVGGHGYIQEMPAVRWRPEW